MKRKVHVIPHSHWDREWYFTTSRSKVYLMKDLKDVLDTLETNNDFKYFMVDAQGSLLEDYIKWMPQDKQRIKKLVKAKKLIIGPWYTQSDQLVISGESIVRNMYYGMKCCETFGEYMNVGYVPDSFGQSGNMPQIYRQFGIEDTLFWRGVSDDMVKHTDYNWRGDDGSVVFTTQIPFGYYIGGNIPEDDKASDEFWQKECFEKAGSRSATKHIYFPNGFDQAPIRKNLPDLIKKRNEKDPDNEYIISCVEDYIKDVKSEKPDLEEVSGELVIAKHMRIHKSIFSSRSDLKVLNTQVQNYVTNILEPMLTMSYHLGNDYPHSAVSEIWKLLFENAAHDSIGSCISDNANEDVYMRYKQARDIAVNLVELHSRLIATKIKNKTNNEITLTLFNTLPKKRNDTIIFETYLPADNFTIKDNHGNHVKYTVIEKTDLTDYVLSQTIRLNPSKNIYLPSVVYQAKIAIEARDVPALGYVQYTIDLDDKSNDDLQEITSMENEYYQITVNKQGSLDIYDKLADYHYQNQAVLVENGDDGDSFNYSPPRQDLEIFSINSEFDYQITGSSLYQKTTINYKMDIPADLQERAKQQTSIKLPVTLEVVLRKGSNIIDLNVHVDNQGLSHRLCILFDSALTTKFNYADQQFGLIKRPNTYDKEMELYLEGLGNQEKAEKPKELANWVNDQSTWQEPPISIEPTQSYVALADKNRGIAVIPQGVREYEIIGEQGNQIRLTLFRTYGFMGKENLVYRPGRASGERIIATPAAQLLKEMDFKLGFTTFNCDINNANIDTLAKEYNTPIEVYEYADFLNGRLIFAQEDEEQILPVTNSLFESENNLVVSAIKKSEDGEGYIIRLFNGKDHQDIGDKLTFNFDISEAYYTNLKEEKIEQIDVVDNSVVIKSISHCKFITILIK